MKSLKRLCVWVLAFYIAVLMITPAATADEKIVLDHTRVLAERKLFDDPTPLMQTYGLNKIMPPGDYAKYCYDIPTMKAKWAEVVGFKAPDVVGKIAPEIQPGKYTYHDKEKYPGLKALMIPTIYEKFFRPGGPPLAGCFSEFEVVPTHQVYFSLPLAEATLKNLGKTRQDPQGFFISSSYESGIPFPKPSGSERVKAMQVLYNLLHRHLGVDQIMCKGVSQSWDKNFRTIYDANQGMWILTLKGRVTDPPYGYYDARAEKRGEASISAVFYFSPRDQYGNVIIWQKIENKVSQLWAYSAGLRRWRKLTGSDSQDTTPGSNLIFDDGEGFLRLLSPTQFPYEYKIIDEREYLTNWFTTDGAEYLTSQGLEFRNVRMERRPMYVIELIQKDPTYVYGRTILYIDKENFRLHWIENYDQQGRLWRGVAPRNFHVPEMGMIYLFTQPNYNFQTMQTNIMRFWPIVPAKWFTREDFSLDNLQKSGK